MGVVVLQLEIVGLRLVGDFKRIDLFVSGQEHGIFWSINEKSHRISDGFSKISGGANETVGGTYLDSFDLKHRCR